MIFRTALLAAALMPAAAPAAPTLAESAAFIEQRFADSQPVDRRPTRAETTRLSLDGCTVTLTTRSYSAVASCKLDDVYASAQDFDDQFDQETTRVLDLADVVGVEHQAILKRITLRLRDGVTVRERNRARKRPSNTSELSGSCRIREQPDSEIVNRDLQLGAMNPDGIGERLAKALDHAAGLCRARRHADGGDAPF